MSISFLKHYYNFSIIFNVVLRSISGRECNPGTRAPENPGKPADFQTRKPGFMCGQKPGFSGFDANT